jgi:subtilase family serine protease
MALKYRPVYNIQTRFILDTQIPENETIDLIPAGQSVSVSVEWSPVTKGQHNLTFVVDPDDLSGTFL